MQCVTHSLENKIMVEKPYGYVLFSFSLTINDVGIEKKEPAGR